MNNYSPHTLDPDEFPQGGSAFDQLLFLLNYAVLAPSSHNTQPWRFRIINEKIEVHADPRRRLASSDLINRQLFLSLGAAIENIVLAAKGHGLKAEVTIYSKGLYAADIKIGGKIDPKPMYLPAILKRHTNRNFFYEENIKQGIINKFKSSCHEHVGITLVEKPGDIQFLARETAAATEKIMSPASFRQELSRWVRNNWTKKPDGMPGFVQGVPGPISLIAPIIISRAPIGKQQAKKDCDILSHSPLCAILSVDTDAQPNWLTAGRCFEHLAIVATINGLNAGALTAPIEHEESAKSIKEYFNIGGRPVALMRFGKAVKQGRHSPRLSVSQTLL